MTSDFTFIAGIFVGCVVVSLLILVYNISIIRGTIPTLNNLPSVIDLHDELESTLTRLLDPSVYDTEITINNSYIEIVVGEWRTVRYRVRIDKDSILYDKAKSLTLNILNEKNVENSINIVLDKE